MKNKAKPVVEYRAFGIAAAIPGLQLAVDRLQDYLDELRAELQALQGGGAPRKEDGRSNPALASQKAKSYWGSMTLEERKREMKRRGMLGRGKGKKKQQPNHPSNPAHPDHAAWVEKKLKTIAAQKKQPKKMPTHPANANHPGHAAWVKRMRAAKAKARAQREQKSVVTLEKTA